MNSTPRGFRPHIAVFGRRNVGKSSFLNALTRQRLSIVSDVPGTTTDPVEKSMEMLPLGPVVLIDTAGVDDKGSLGTLRVERTWRVLEKTDMAVLVTDCREWTAVEDGLIARFEAASVPGIVVMNKSDLGEGDPEREAALRKRGFRVVRAAAASGAGIDEFRQALLDTAPEELLQAPTIVGDLIRPGDIIMLVVPVDMEAPKGRIILPQVQTIRDALDNNACSMVVKENGLRDTLARLKVPPALVVTDSQAFKLVAAETPETVPLTSFSILFARLKGDLGAFVEGTLAIDRLKPGDKVLIAEACTHHPVGDDIGRVKIPRWLSERAGGALDITVVSGRDFPESLGEYRLVVHCGSCMFNRRNVLSRILQCRQSGVPITNYGLAIAHSLGLLRRALGPFREAHIQAQLLKAAGHLPAGRQATKEGRPPCR